MLSLWANWLVTKFGLNSLKRYLHVWPVLYIYMYGYVWSKKEEKRNPSLQQTLSMRFFLNSKVKDSKYCVTAENFMPLLENSFICVNKLNIIRIVFCV